MSKLIKSRNPVKRLLERIERVKARPPIIQDGLTAFVGSAVPASSPSSSGPQTFALSTDPAANVATSTANIDDYNGVIITLTGAGNAQTMQDPTNTAPGLWYIVADDDNGASKITVDGIELAAGEGVSFLWDGDDWCVVGQGKTGGVGGVNWTGGGTGTITQDDTDDNVLITQTKTNGSGLYVVRNLAAGNTDGALVRIEHGNVGDDQPALHITNAGTNSASRGVLCYTGDSNAYLGRNNDATEATCQLENQDAAGPVLQLDEPGAGNNITLKVPPLVADINYTEPAAGGAVGDILAISAAAAPAFTKAWKTPTVTLHNAFTVYNGLPERFLDQNIHGAFIRLGNYAIIRVPPVMGNVGLSKIFFDVIAATDSAGTFRITGTSVHRDTGAETPGDSEDITVAGLTTDNSAVDANGNTLHAFVNGYITSKWWKGAVVITTANLSLESVDLWQVSFEQFGDHDDITLDIMDITATPVNAAAELDCYLYSVIPSTGSKCDIAREADLNVTGVTANLTYRLRKAGIAKAMDGSTDGIFVKMHLLRNAQQDWQDVNLKVWYEQKVSVDLA